MKCRECGSCYKGFWASQPESYVCVESEEPFEILDINMECSKPSNSEQPNNKIYTL